MLNVKIVEYCFLKKKHRSPQETMTQVFKFFHNPLLSIFLLKIVQKDAGIKRQKQTQTRTKSMHGFQAISIEQCF